MSITQIRVIGAIVFFVLIFASGFWLGISGKPYNSAILNAHKLISLVAVALFGVTIYQINKASGLNAIELVLAIVAGVLSLGTIVSGGLSSISTMPAFLVRIHQITLSLATVLIGVTLYCLLRGG